MLKKLSVFLVLIAGILWGVIGIFVRHFQELGLASLELTLVRAFISAIIFAIFILIYDRKLFKIKLKDIWIFIVTGIVSVSVFSFCYFKAMELMNLSTACILLYTSPTFVMIFSIFIFKEKISFSKLVALIIAFLGCLCVTGAITGNLQITFQGLLFGVTSAVCYALYSVFSRIAMDKGYNPLTVVLYTLLLAGFSLLIVADPMQVVNLVKEKPSESLWILGFVFSSEVIPYFTFTVGLKYMKPSSASIIVSVEPVVATIIGALVFKEAIPVPFGYIGIILVIISIILVNMSENLAAKREEILEYRKRRKVIKMKGIGDSPLVKLDKIKIKLGLLGNIYAKVESYNLTGSIKDRAALFMLDDAEEKGIIKEGATIIEPTSGNTGIGLSAICKERGYKAIIVMPDTMSKERIEMMEQYGAEVVLTEGAKGMAGSIEKAKELNKEIENSFIPSQFTNPANARAHYETTGPEIYYKLGKKVDVFVSAVGSGGTITGIGRFLKEQDKNVKIVAVEPKDSPLLSGGKAGPHKIQGIGANFIPELLDTSIYDEVITVSNEDAFEYEKMLFDMEGLEVGISSGAALCAGIELAKREENKDKNIVIVLPDSYNRYKSLNIL